MPAYADITSVPSRTGVRVTRYWDGVVVHRKGDSESWWTTVFLPRDVCVAALKQWELQSAFYKSHNPRPTPDVIASWWLGSAGYGGPGQPFVAMPVRLRGRKWIVFSQHGGLDT